jgi:hypothetical protein
VSYSTIYCVQTFRRQGRGVERDCLWSYGLREDAAARGQAVRARSAGMAVYSVEIDTAARCVGRVTFIERCGQLPPYEI